MEGPDTSNMPRLASALLLVAFSGASVFAQQQNPAPAPQNGQDVPTQKPGTNNPDIGKQRQPTPKSDGQTDPADVPHQNQQPGTNSPDVAKQRKETPKKKSKRTDSSTNQ